MVQGNESSDSRSKLDTTYIFDKNSKSEECGVESTDCYDTRDSPCLRTGLVQYAIKWVKMAPDR